MDKDRFFSGIGFCDYISSMDPNNRVYFEKNFDAWFIPEEILRRLQRGVRAAYVLASTEGWCPDCRVNLPLLRKMLDAIPGKSSVLMCHSRDTCADIGVLKIPTFIFFDESWAEVGRWVERPLSYKKIMSEGSDEEKQEAKKRYFTGYYNMETLNEILQIIGI